MNEKFTGEEGGEGLAVGFDLIWKAFDEVDSTIANELTALEDNAPDHLAPMEAQLEYMKKANQLSGQREGLYRYIGTLNDKIQKTSSGE